MFKISCKPPFQRAFSQPIAILLPCKIVVSLAQLNSYKLSLSWMFFVDITYVSLTFRMKSQVLIRWEWHWNPLKWPRIIFVILYNNVLFNNNVLHVPAILIYKTNLRSNLISQIFLTINPESVLLQLSEKLNLPDWCRTKSQEVRTP